MQILAALLRLRNSTQNNLPEVDSSTHSTLNPNNAANQTARLYLAYPFYLYGRPPVTIS